MPCMGIFMSNTTITIITRKKLTTTKNYENTYPSNFYSLFGSGKNINI